jgi:thiopeptide-type bacteriocin biosynthesis protein
MGRMPADRLAAPSAEITEAMILGVLSGRPVPVADVQRPELAAATAIYQQAGRAALAKAVRTDWQQLYLRFTDHQHDEQIAAAHLLPILRQATHAGAVASWWFIRKHPCWRLRLLPAHPGDDLAAIGAGLDELVDAGHLDGWWPGIYEAETAAFGGGQAMDVAHRMFAADSLGTLELARAGSSELGRRELSVLLCSALMRGAGLEWYERGDVWDRVTAERHLPAEIPAEKIAGMAGSLRTLMIADTNGDGPQFGPHGSAAQQHDWAQAFTDGGRDLAALNHTGELRRGLRHVLSYHVIFHWNRMGFTALTQAILAHAAREAILGPPPEPAT